MSGRFGRLVLVPALLILVFVVSSQSLRADDGPTPAQIDRALKELAELSAQRKRIEARELPENLALKRAIEDEGVEHARQAARLEAVVADYSARCAGETLSQREYAVCREEQQKVNASVQRWNERLSELQARETKRAEVARRLKERFDAAGARMALLESELLKHPAFAREAGRCQDRPDDARLQCLRSLWDGVKR